jgi:hypothetical protein
MSDADHSSLPFVADQSFSDLEALIQRVVQRTLAQVGYADQTNSFINSKACADLIGVSPEHLCAMRARGQGPPWSGEGKWIRYRRSDAISWLAQLPTASQRDANTSTSK